MKNLSSCGCAVTDFMRRNFYNFHCTRLMSPGAGNVAFDTRRLPTYWFTGTGILPMGQLNVMGPDQLLQLHNTDLSGFPGIVTGSYDLNPLMPKEGYTNE